MHGSMLPYGYFTDSEKISFDDLPSMLSSDMARIPDIFMQSGCFLYPTKEDADKNARIGGTGFLIGVKLPNVSKMLGGDMYFPIVISNRHVVWNYGASVVRMNRRDGGKAVFEANPDEWIVHPEGDDLAALSLFGKIDRAGVEHGFCPIDDFFTEDLVKSKQVGVGDEVFMIGRFINHQGDETKIIPSARFGNISQMPQPIWNKAIKKNQLSYAVEMRSRTGFSGSPVIAWRNRGTVLASEVRPENYFFFALLGVSWGYIVERDEENKDMDGENTWLNGIIPAWRILDILETPKMKKAIKDADNPQEGDDIIVLTGDDNPQHKEDFSRLLGEAVSKKQPKKGT